MKYWCHSIILLTKWMKLALAQYAPEPDQPRNLAFPSRKRKISPKSCDVSVCWVQRTCRNFGWNHVICFLEIDMAQNLGLSQCWRMHRLDIHSRILALFWGNRRVPVPTVWTIPKYANMVIETLSKMGTVEKWHLNETSKWHCLVWRRMVEIQHGISETEWKSTICFLLILVRHGSGSGISNHTLNNAREGWRWIN